MYKGKNQLYTVGNIKRKAEILVEELSKQFKEDTFSLKRRPEEHCNKMLYPNGTWDIFVTVQEGVELNAIQYTYMWYYAEGVVSVLSSKNGICDDLPF